MLSNIPQSKWGPGTGRQVILKNDFAYIEQALLELSELQQLPDLTWVDNTAVKVAATADCQARVLMAGFPSPVHLNLLVDGGLSDGKYRANFVDAVMDFDTAAHLWGNEKASQWYVIYATAADAATTFALKAMPLMRYASQNSQVISLRNNGNTANIGYGLATDELKDGKLLILTGASRGLLRTITANNNDNGTGGTVTYSGTALTMAQGDWFVVLPPGINFRYLGMILNNSSGNIVNFVQRGRSFRWVEAQAWASGAINGWSVRALDLVVPVTARLVHGLAQAAFGSNLKLAISYDGANSSQIIHQAGTAGTFKGAGPAAGFTFNPLANHTIYLDNENTANQNYLIVGWEE